MRHGFGVAAACAVTFALAGCAGGSSSLQAQSATDLHERVAGVRAAALAGDADTARTVLGSFRADVQRLIDSGSLDRSAGMALLAHADAVAAGIEDEVTPAPTAEPSPEPTPTYTVVPMPEITDARRERAMAEFSELLRAKLTERLQAALIEEAQKQQAEQQAAEREKEREREKDERKKDAKKDRKDRHDGGGRHDN